MRSDHALLDAIHAHLPRLEEQLAAVESEWVFYDLIYRFYHQSFKVFYLQATTEQIVASLRAVGETAGLVELDEWFCQIIADGTNKTFSLEDNDRWLDATRGIVEAFFHAHFMLSAAVRAGRELTGAPNLLPSHWAAVLSLYKIR